MKISIIIPTRLRSDKLPSLIDNIFNTAKNKEEIEVVFCVETTDISTREFMYKHSNNNIKWVLCDSIANNIIFSELNNLAYKYSNGEILLIGSDDIKFHLQDWDTLVINCFEKYPDKILLVNPRDGIQNGIQAPHFFIHRNWANILGYVVPPYFNSWYNDTWVTKIAQSLGRYLYLPEFFLEHLHPQRTKVASDTTRIEKDAGIEKDHETWRRTEHLRKEDIKKLQTFIANFKEI